ncbi:MAG: hypothetical protein K2X91_14050, partial [Thermoleophilia bacterium]|nr:hypothetical protein [Thermoleophilia bacterium]
MNRDKFPPRGGARPRPARRWSPRIDALEDRKLLAVFDRTALLDGLRPDGPAPDLYRLSDDLVDLYATEVRRLTPPAVDGGITPYSAPLIRDALGRVAVRVTAADVAALEPTLADLGFVTSVAMPDHHLIEGYLPISELVDVTTLVPQGLLGVLGIAAPMTSAGAVSNQADSTMQAGRVRATAPPGLTGAGVTIGVLSDSYNNLGGAAAGIASGDLPASLVLLRDNVPATTGANGTDEGRGMMELVHDVAPGSPKAFATAFGGEATFAQNIR